MKRGQISLDLLLSLIVAIIVVTSFYSLITEYRKVEEQQNTQQQINLLTENTANLITSTQSLSDTNFNIQIKIQKISYIDSNNATQNEYPQLSIISTLDANILNAKLIIAPGKIIDHNSTIIIEPNTKIDFINTQTRGLLVIRNA